MRQYVGRLSNQCSCPCAVLHASRDQLMSTKKHSDGIQNNHPIFCELNTSIFVLNNLKLVDASLIERIAGRGEVTATMSSSKETFEKVSDYINAELKASLKDYEFITKLNKTTTASFKDYNAVAEKIAKNINRINENQMAQARLDNLVTALDDLESKISSLEALAYKIDSYSMRLEDTFKKLESSTSSNPPSSQTSQQSSLATTAEK